MASEMMRMLPTHFDQYNKKSLFIFTGEDYTKLLITDSYAVSYHNPEFCSFDGCKFHVLLIGDDGGVLLEKLSRYSFDYMMVDCFYAVFKYLIFNGLEMNVTRVGETIKLAESAVRHNRTRPHMEVQPSVLRKKVTRKARKSNVGIILKKTMATQTIPNLLQERVTAILNGEHAADFMKIVDFIQAGGGFIQSDKINFNM